MDANAPPKRADKRSPPHKVDDLSLLEKREEPDPPGETGEVPREPDETTLGAWLQGFFQQSPPPPTLGPLPPGLAPDSDSSDTSLDLADAVEDAWPRPANRRFDITRTDRSDRPPRSARPAPHPLRRKIRRLLRNRISPADAARIVAMTILLLAGAGLIVATALRYVTHISPSGAARAPWQIPLLLASTALTWILGLTIPSLVMIKIIADLPWFRVGLYFSIVWFLAGLALFL